MEQKMNILDEHQKKITFVLYMIVQIYSTSTFLVDILFFAKLYYVLVFDNLMLWENDNLRSLLKDTPEPRLKL